MVREDNLEIAMHAYSEGECEFAHGDRNCNGYLMVVVVNEQYILSLCRYARDAFRRGGFDLEVLVR